MKGRLKNLVIRVKHYLSGLSFRTGVILLVVCVLLYILSFAQLLLPLSAATKSTLWVVLFGMAKAAQYAAIAILGVEGWRRLTSRKRGN